MKVAQFLGRKVLLGMWIMVVAGCQSLPLSSIQPISVKYPQSDKLDFTGRGSAAAMMMSGSMGAMGIAIGVAIDEGISKDLTASAVAGGFNAQKSFSSALNTAGYRLVPDDAAYTLVIEKLGFKAKGDLITPWVELVFAEDDAVASCHYLELVGDEALTAELGELKDNGAKASSLLDMAINTTVSKCKIDAVVNL